MTKWKIMGVGMLCMGVLLSGLYFQQTTAISPKQQTLSQKQQQKASLNNAKKKLSTDLLQIIDDEFLPQSKSMEEAKNDMMDLDQITPASAIPKNSKKQIAAPTETSFVYIHLNPGAALSTVQNLIWEVVNYDPTKNILAAYVEVNKLETIGANPAVKQIRSVLPPAHQHRFCNHSWRYYPQQ